MITEVWQTANGERGNYCADITAEACSLRSI